MELLVLNLKDEGGASGKDPRVQILTLKMLNFLFAADPHNYALLFEQCDGIDPLEELQYSEHRLTYELASLTIQTYFQGECEVDQDAVASGDGNKEDYSEQRPSQ